MSSMAAVAAISRFVRNAMTGIVTPDQNTGFWDGDPVKLVETLAIDRASFSTALGIPESLPGGERNVALDQAIPDAALVLDRRVGYAGPLEFPAQVTDVRIDAAIVGQ